MIDLSFAGLVGAVIGTVIAALVYAPVVGLVDRGLRSRQEVATAGERETFEQEISMLRRVVLLIDIIVFAGVGYWLGQAIAG
jgi:hypothetical protein